ncbi:MAG TPA: helix-turn-helix domain-containing protein [Gaiellaceae bacterium]|nr:helix-turn-helix domain-containing protein [Gaiellaceae bacterium]
MSSRAYRARSRPKRSEETRERIKAAVRELLAEGTFHESTVEEVADRAGVSRATLYQHFRSRVELVDAICETFDLNPALLRLRETVDGPDPGAALADTVADAVRFWSSEDPVLRHLYGVASIDPAAQDLVDRQRADRRTELERLARNLSRSRRLREGMNEQRAVSLLLVLTSYDTFRELREAGLTDRQLTTTLQQAARDLLT